MQNTGTSTPVVDDIERLFTFQPPTDETKPKYVLIRDAAKQLARVIDAQVPAGPDRTDAMRKLREVVMVANAAIATGGQHYR